MLTVPGPKTINPQHQALDGMDTELRKEQFSLFPEMQFQCRKYPTARRSLKSHEVRVLQASMGASKLHLRGIDEPITIQPPSFTGPNGR